MGGHAPGGMPPLRHLQTSAPASKFQMSAGDNPCPTCLVAGADPCAVITMQILVIQQIVSPVGITLELLCTTEHRTLMAIGTARRASAELAISWATPVGHSILKLSP